MRLLDAATSRVLYYAVLGVLLLGMALSVGEVRHDRGLGWTVAWMTCLVALVAAVTGAVSFGHERSGGGYDLLRASPLRPPAILAGKMAGVFAGLLLLVAVPSGTALLTTVAGNSSGGAAAGAVIAAMLYPAAWGVAGMAFGITAGTTRAAVVRAVVLYAGALIGLPLAALVLGLLGFDGNFLGVLVLGSPPGVIYGFIAFCAEWGSTGSGNLGAPYEFAGGVWFLGTVFLAAGTLWILPRVLSRRMDRDRVEG
jgi:hypothetical protein